MANFRAYPGLWLKATEDHGPHIKKDSVYQLIAAGQSFNTFFTFVGVQGLYKASGKGWEPMYDYDEYKE